MANELTGGNEDSGTEAQPGPWFILGAGCLGTVLAFRLSRQGVPCKLLSHRGADERSVLVDGDPYGVRVEALAAQAPQSIGRLLLTTKAGQIDAALQLAGPKLQSDAVLLTPANGLGFATSLETAGVELPLQRAVSTAAAYRDEAGNIVLAAIGDTRVGVPGAAHPPARWFLDSLSRLPDWQWDPQIATAIERKFAINCVINPLTAQRRCLNGDLLDQGEGEALLEQLSSEVEANLRSLGLWREATPLQQYVQKVCRATAVNRSSMLQDVLAGRPTEIEYLSGELLRRRACLNSPPAAALSEALYEQLRERANPGDS
ncbi:MAG: 2-dehydropantoate 2-reductase [Pseudomonadota bacterium]